MQFLADTPFMLGPVTFESRLACKVVFDHAIFRKIFFMLIIATRTRQVGWDTR
jgi:hypothetical protein